MEQSSIVIAWVLAVRGWADYLLDAIAFAAARGAVDAVRYRPRELGLGAACAASQPEMPAPVARWIADAPRLPAVMVVSRMPHAMVREVAAEAARWFGPTASAIIRWCAGALATAADRLGGATVQGPLVARVHPGLLVPHQHAAAVLSVDMRGFSMLTRALHDSRHLVTLIEEYLTVLTRVVERYRGVVFQYTGDGLLAVFLPELAGMSQDEMLDRLVHGMAAEMHGTFDGTYDRWRAEWSARGLAHVEIGLGAGMSFGEATVGFMGPAGKKQIGVLGEPVNLAAYLCSQAYAGTVLVDVESFARAGASPPPVPIVRLRSKKRHQRIRTMRFRYGERPPRRRALADLASRLGLRRGESQNRWFWPLSLSH